MEFLKRICWYLLALALILLVGAGIWYLMFYHAPQDYTGGILVRLEEPVKEMG